MFDRVVKFVESFSALSELSLRLSCPLHCGASALPWFAAGLCLGLTLALLALAFLALSALKLYRPWTEVEVETARALHLVRRARVGGYRE